LYYAVRLLTRKKNPLDQTRKENQVEKQTEEGRTKNSYHILWYLNVCTCVVTVLRICPLMLSFHHCLLLLLVSVPSRPEASWRPRHHRRLFRARRAGPHVRSLQTVNDAEARIRLVRGIVCRRSELRGGATLSAKKVVPPYPYKNSLIK
jgi:hypothetical protein